MKEDECRKLEKKLQEKLMKLRINDDLPIELKMLNDEMLDLQKMTRELLSQSNRRLLLKLCGNCLRYTGF